MKNFFTINAVLTLVCAVGWSSIYVRRGAQKLARCPKAGERGFPRLSPLTVEIGCDVAWLAFHAEKISLLFDPCCDISGVLCPHSRVRELLFHVRHQLIDS